MANADAKTQARASLMTARILWASLLGATVMFLGVLLFLGPQQHREPVAAMLPAFGLVALTIAVLSFVLPQRLYTQALERIEIDVVERPGAQGSDVIPDRAAPARRVAKKPAKALRRAFGIYQTKLVLACALGESVAVFGFLLGFTGHPLLHALPFFVISWALLLLQFPTLAKILGPVEARIQAQIMP